MIQDIGHIRSQIDVELFKNIKQRHVFLGGDIQLILLVIPEFDLAEIASTLVYEPKQCEQKVQMDIDYLRKEGIIRCVVPSWNPHMPSDQFVLFQEIDNNQPCSVFLAEPVYYIQLI